MCSLAAPTNCDENLHGLQELAGELLMFLVAPGVAEGGELAVQDGELMLQLVVEVFQPVGEAPQLGGIDDGSGHATLLQGRTRRRGADPSTIARGRAAVNRGPGRSHRTVVSPRPTQGLGVSFGGSPGEGSVRPGERQARRGRLPRRDVLELIGRKVLDRGDHLELAVRSLATLTRLGTAAPGRCPRAGRTCRRWASCRRRSGAPPGGWRPRSTSRGRPPS